MLRNKNRFIVAGICSGLADEMEVSVWLTRIFFTVSFFLFGFGFFLYLALWFSMPENTGQLTIG